MTQKHVGGWIVDPEKRTATAGDLVVTVVPQGGGTFCLSYSGDIAPGEQLRIAREVTRVFENASCTVLPLANML